MCVVQNKYLYLDHSHLRFYSTDNSAKNSDKKAKTNSLLPLQWAKVVAVEAPQELANEKMQAERILGERTVFAKGRRGVGPVVRLQLDGFSHQSR